jgi:hypothetical protein
VLALLEKRGKFSSQLFWYFLPLIGRSISRAHIYFIKTEKSSFEMEAIDLMNHQKREEHIARRRELNRLRKAFLNEKDRADEKEEKFAIFPQFAICVFSQFAICAQFRFSRICYVVQMLKSLSF